MRPSSAWSGADLCTVCQIKKMLRPGVNSSRRVGGGGGIKALVELTDP